MIPASRSRENRHRNRTAHARTFAAILSVLTLAFSDLTVPATPAADRSPNVLLILTDDQGYGDIGSHGNPDLKTPVLDRLATQGARFERFFVSPVCAPTRASLLTGRYHLRTGVHGVTRGYENMRPGEVTVAEVLRGAGYATGAFGKWHNGRHMPCHPNGQGFDTFIGFCGGHWNTYFDPPLERNGTPIERKGYITDVLTDAAIQFMEEPRDEPWFCYVPYNTPHSPWRVPEGNWLRYNGLGLDAKAQCAYAMVDNIDWNVGRLLDTVAALGVENDTIVLFMTDNGANSDRFNAGMRGRKGSVDEGGTRVPLFIRYPRLIKPGTVIEPIAFHLDLLPTLAEFCGVTLAPDHQRSLDGRSLVPLLTDSTAARANWPDRILFTENFRIERPRDQTRAAVRTDRWRATRQGGKWRLFDMHADPGQDRDVAPERGDVVTRLSTAFDRWFDDVLTVEPDYPPIPVGYPTRDIFDLPANEAMLLPRPGQGIEYTGDGANGWANSWIHRWTDRNAYPEWIIDVLEPGEYRIDLVHTCKREDVGVRLAVHVGDARITVNVSASFESPLKPKPDRIYSDNYQDKAEWAVLNAGGLFLDRGRQRLSIRIDEFARKTESSQAIELKAVRLSPIK